jgi:hypothetical protein
VAHDVGNTAVSVENMLDAGNTKITDLLSVTSPAIPQGAHAMTQLVELPPADAWPAATSTFGAGIRLHVGGAGCSSSSRV